VFKFRTKSHSRWNMCLMRNIMSAPQKFRYAPHTNATSRLVIVLLQWERRGRRPLDGLLLWERWEEGADERQSKVRMTWRNVGAWRVVFGRGGWVVLGFNLCWEITPGVIAIAVSLYFTCAQWIKYPVEKESERRSLGELFRWLYQASNFDVCFQYSLLIICELCSALITLLTSWPAGCHCSVPVWTFQFKLQWGGCLIPNQHHHNIPLILCFARKEVRQCVAMHDSSLRIDMQCETYPGDRLCLRSVQRRDQRSLETKTGGNLSHHTSIYAMSASTPTFIPVIHSISLRNHFLCYERSPVRTWQSVSCRF